MRTQLGLPDAHLDREPDIVVRFVDHLELSSPLRYLGLDDAGFTKDQYLVLRTRHKVPALVQIPFEHIGRTPELVCERGLPAVPLLVPIVNLTMLSKGVLPLHAAAFVHRGNGILVTGWSKGGKTETLLGFMSRGAEYVGDEWVYLVPGSGRMFGIPEPIRVWDWHLDCLPKYRRVVRPADAARLRAIKALQRMKCGVGPRPAMLSRVLRLLERQLYVDVAPGRLFGRGVGAMAANLDRVFLVSSHAAPDIVVEPIDAQEIVACMPYSLQYERAGLFEHYLKFRFAFPDPDKANPLVEQADAVQRGLLEQALRGKPAYAVRHPYPVEIDRLVEAMDGFCP